MMPDGDTTAHLRKQVGGLFLRLNRMARFRSRSILYHAVVRVNVMKEMRPADQIWLLVRREAESAVARDPVFAAALSSAILDHPNFARALAHQIGARLG